MFKLRGHKGMVTDLAFASDDGVLLSCRCGSAALHLDALP